jgi:hypothetical protein
MYAAISVTRLEDYSTIGRLFTLLAFLNIPMYISSQKFCASFFPRKLSSNFDEHFLGPHLRQFFHNLIWSPWLQYEVSTKNIFGSKCGIQQYEGWR